MEQVRQDLRLEGSQIYLRPITVEDTDIIIIFSKLCFVNRYNQKEKTFL